MTFTSCAKSCTLAEPPNTMNTGRDLSSWLPRRVPDWVPESVNGAAVSQKAAEHGDEERGSALAPAWGAG